MCRRQPVIDHVDPFIGSAATDLPTPQGLAETWWWPKPQVGNTHPGATFPFGMVSACAYSGAYPTGYGRYQLNTEGVPTELYDRQLASGFTHFQQSGTGAIRKYYNYFRVSPMVVPRDDLGECWDLLDERAEPGYYACTLSSGIRCELTVGPRSAVHRYTFPAHRDARIVIDFSMGGLALPYGATVPLRAHLEAIGPGVVQAETVVEGAPLATHVECDAVDWRQLLWYDRRLMHGGTRLDFDRIRQTTLRPFGLMWRGPTDPGQVVEVRFGFSLRGVEHARTNLQVDCAPRTRDDGGRLSPEGDSRIEDPTQPVSAAGAFEGRRRQSAGAWREHLDTIKVETASPARKTVFATALYHSLIKPCFATGESPFWPSNGPFAFDICTMWDIYRTQLPLMTALFPARAAELANAMLNICEEEGNMPIGYRMAKGADRFSRQGSALCHTFLADLCQLGINGVDWDWALCHMDNDLRRAYGEEFLIRGVTHPITHTLDIFFGYGADPVKQVGERPTVEELNAGYALNRFEGLNNEPDMEVPWAYHYIGRPDRTAEVVHAALHNMFGLGRGGLPGNDDSGGLSSWYVWASLGLFPVAGQSLYLVNAPSFARARLDLGGRELVIDT